MSDLEEILSGRIMRHKRLRVGENGCILEETWISKWDPKKWDFTSLRIDNIEQIKAMGGSVDIVNPTYAKLLEEYKRQKRNDEKLAKYCRM